MARSSVRERVERFTERFGMRVPIIEAPMAGICPPLRAIAIANAGGMGAMGAVLSAPAKITGWVSEVRAYSSGPFQLNLWIPEEAGPRDAASEAAMRALLSRFGPAVDAAAGDFKPPQFAFQCEAILAAKPAVVSSIMGLFPANYVKCFKAAGIAWFACVTTLAEALAAEAAGADAVVAQGIEAGGHRGTFNPAEADKIGVGLFSLLPQLADRLTIPVIAAGGIMNGKSLAAALLLGASAVQIGTALLRAPESNAPSAWADRLTSLAPEDTIVTRAFSGRPGRGIENRFIRSVQEQGLAIPPYPVQRGLTASMRSGAINSDSLDGMQAWAGQSARLANAWPAARIVNEMWAEADALLRV